VALGDFEFVARMRLQLRYRWENATHAQNAAETGISAAKRPG
jgi:hypothetical protein